MRGRIAGNSITGALQRSMSRYQRIKRIKWISPNVSLQETPLRILRMYTSEIPPPHLAQPAIEHVAVQLARSTKLQMAAFRSAVTI